MSAASCRRHVSAPTMGYQHAVYLEYKSRDVPFAIGMGVGYYLSVLPRPSLGYHMSDGTHRSVEQRGAS